MSIYLKMLQYAWPYKFKGFTYAILTVLYAVFSVANLAILIPLLNILFNQVEGEVSKSLPAFSLSIGYLRDLFNYYFHLIIQEYGKWAALKFVCTVTVISMCFANVFRYLSSLIIVKINMDAVKDLRKELFAKVINLPLSFFANKKRGDILARFLHDVIEVEGSILGSLKSVLKDPIFIVGYFAVLITISLKLSLITFLVLPISGVAIARIIKSLRRRAHQQQASAGEINSIVEETIHAMPVIKSFTAENYMNRQFASELNHYTKISFSVSRKLNSAGPISELCGLVVIIALILVGGYLILSEQSALSASEFITFIIIVSQILGPVKSIHSSISSIQTGLAGGKRILELLEIDNTIKDITPTKPLHTFQKNILFRNVCFRYEENSVLEDINLQIRKNEHVALVGESGAGKSTLSYLLPRFYDIDQGEILLDGYNIKNYKISDLRTLIGVVSQDTILFHDTIYQNIAFGRPEASREEVIEAAKLANAHHFIEEQSQGYDTIIGEKGLKLSGGQRQRISIARTILKNPPILILDEATSSLDSVSENMVQEALHYAMKDRTSLVIAHRLSTIKYVDRIIVLEKGRIQAMGSHQELLDKSRLYKEFIDMQSLS